MASSTRLNLAAGVAVVFLTVSVIFVGSLWPNRANVDVLDVEWNTPGEVTLIVDSCNGGPEAVVTDLVDGRYTVNVRTTRSYPSGNDCADLVVVAVDPTLASFEVEDLGSGTVFALPEGSPAPVDVLDGTWRMTDVNGAPVAVGVNTSQIPEIRIDAGFLTGDLGCNSGGGEILRTDDVVMVVVESTEEQCSVPDGGDEMVPTEQTLVELFAEGALLDLQADTMTLSGAAGSVTFVRVEG